MTNVYTGNKWVKHVGFYNDKRCAVVLQLPEDRDNVFIIETDNLPDQYHDYLMKTINSEEAQAQECVWLGDVLNRRVTHNGEKALKMFFESGFIKRVPVSHVQMAPRPNHHVPLEDVIDGMREATMSQDDIASANASQNPNGEATTLQEDTTQQNAEVVGDATEFGVQPTDNKAVAEGLLLEAEMLEKEASQKRQQAYEMSPELNQNNDTEDQTSQSPQSGLEPEITNIAEMNTGDASKNI